MIAKSKVLVLGVGNTIRGDDGMGIHLARRLRGALPEKFEIRELPTAGLDLIDALSGYVKAILIDAVQTPEGKPGEVYRLSLQEFKNCFNLSSMHALDLSQVLELGKKIAKKHMPQVEIIAIEAKRINQFSEELSPQLKNNFDKIFDTVRTEIMRGN